MLQIISVVSSFIFYLFFSCLINSLVAQMVKNLPVMQETQIWLLGWEGPLEKEMTTHSSILAWRIPFLVGCNTWICKVSDRTEQLTIHFSGNQIFSLWVSYYPLHICVNLPPDGMSVLTACRSLPRQLLYSSSPIHALKRKIQSCVP